MLVLVAMAAMILLSAAPAAAQTCDEIEGCENGGTCFDVVVDNTTEAVCRCPIEWTGDFCQQLALCSACTGVNETCQTQCIPPDPCLDVECDLGEGCFEFLGVAVCANPCEFFVCLGENQQCVVSADATAICVCLDGFGGPDCTACVAPDPCAALLVPCLSNTTCLAVNGTATCVDPCATESLAPNCSCHESCVTLRGHAQCVCLSGWGGPDCSEECDDGADLRIAVFVWWILFVVVAILVIQVTVLVLWFLYWGPAAHQRTLCLSCGCCCGSRTQRLGTLCHQAMCCCGLWGALSRCCCDDEDDEDPHAEAVIEATTVTSRTSVTHQPPHRKSHTRPVPASSAASQ